MTADVHYCSMSTFQMAMTEHVPLGLNVGDAIAEKLCQVGVRHRVSHHYGLTIAGSPLSVRCRSVATPLCFIETYML